MSHVPGFCPHLSMLSGTNEPQGDSVVASTPGAVHLFYLVPLSASPSQAQVLRTRLSFHFCGIDTCG